MTLELKQFFILVTIAPRNADHALAFDPEAALTEEFYGTQATSAQLDAIRALYPDMGTTHITGVWSTRKAARAARANILPSFLEGGWRVVIRPVGTTMRDLREVAYWKLQYKDDTDLVGDFSDSTMYTERYTTRKAAREEAKRQTWGGLTYRAVPVYKTEG
jgi:hypothetical protein